MDYKKKYLKYKKIFKFTKRYDWWIRKKFRRGI